MNNINTIPIEMFLDKARIAIKSGQKGLNLDIKEVQALYDSLAVTMTRLAGSSTVQLADSKPQQVIEVKMDGGTF